MSNATVLLADDEDTLRQNLAQVLTDEGFDVIACPDGTEALRVLKRRTVDVLVTDLHMPGVRGMELIDRATELAPEVAIIVITAFGEVETAVEAMKKGVRDCICKPLIFDEIILKLKQLLADKQLVKENRQLREQILWARDPVVMMGGSQATQAIRETIQRISHTSSNVLICGESGTGKEVVARVLHESGVTKDRPFVAVKCGGLSEHLVESELFGYRRGTFTAAKADRIGYFEAADGGSLFLDDISSLPLHSQSVLLRTIEQKVVTRVGDHLPRSVEIRIIAATSHDLEKAVDAGDFREDLYSRLNGIKITVLPLRERRDDIPDLISHFVKKYNAVLKCECPGFTPEAISVMCSKSWRGNVRELQNVVERALILASGKEIGKEELIFILGTGAPAKPCAEDPRGAAREF